MRPNFSREGWVAGYLGQCPKFDRFFFLMASLTKVWERLGEIGWDWVSLSEVGRGYLSLGEVR